MSYEEVKGVSIGIKFGQERSASTISSVVFVEDIVELVPCVFLRERSNIEGIREALSVLIWDLKLFLQDTFIHI